MVKMIDWNEVEELLCAGYHPYRFRCGKYEYMALKKGRGSRGLGAYDEETWNRLTSLYNIHQYDSKTSTEEEQFAKKPKPEVQVSKETLAHIISELEDGKSRVQIVAEWDYHPDVVNYAYETWLKLKEPTQQATTSEVQQLRAQYAALQTQLEALKSQLEETQKRLNDLEKTRASVERRGKLLFATCHYARNGKCTEPNVIETLGKSGEIEVDVDEYICNSCLCYLRFQ
ncbi:DUF2968 domain-containing protein [Candidatus Bathyarchaeota archaeon A05DMB-2]|jgi:predicted RNase H-like nuclease (RuvC/YqgF family)|nr:DUF2968 domain-containing protein [Candidatus Bathyarchaeota archaeon A05DMB-2]